MNIISVILLSVTICIDSFILCLLSKTKKKRQILLIPFIFSLTQILFLYAGYSIGNLIEIYLKDYLKYIVFFIFSFMSLKLIIDSFLNKEEGKPPLSSFPIILIQACLTSFDSLFLGLPLAFIDLNYILSVLIIGITTFIMCFIALLIRNKISSKSEEKINLVGSILLMFFAFKSLI